MDSFRYERGYTKLFCKKTKTKKQKQQQQHIHWLLYWATPQSHSLLERDFLNTRSNFKVVDRDVHKVLQIQKLVLVMFWVWRMGIPQVPNFYMNHRLFWKINDTSKTQAKQKMHRQTRTRMQFSSQGRWRSWRSWRVRV